MASPASVTARAAYQKGDYGLAERLYRSLCVSEPQWPQWHLDLATLYITLIRYEEAEVSLKRAASVGAEDPEIQRQVALCYFSMYRPDVARRLLEPAVAAKHFPSVLGLLLLMERQGLIEEALDLLETSLRDQPRHPELRLLRAQLLVRQSRWELGETEARSLLQTSLPFFLRSKTVHLLAGILDRTERHHEAFTVLHEIKQVARTLPGVMRMQKEFRDRMTLARELAATFKTEQWRDWQEQAADHPLAFRPALLCGHPRSGTTLLEGRIERLENVISFEETGAFDGGALSSAGLVGRVQLMSSLRPPGRERAMSARSHYARSIASLHGGPLLDRQRVIDKNPSQLIHLILWLRLLPEVRILIALRDPRDVVVSSYFFDLPLNATSAQFLDWESTARHYASFMDLWMKMKAKLPAECWTESRYEDLVMNAPAETARVARFLDVSNHEKKETIPSATQHSPNYATASQPVHGRSVGRWHHHRENLQVTEKWLAPFLKEFSYE